MNGKNKKKNSEEKEIKHFKIQNPKCFNILGCYFLYKRQIAVVDTHKHSQAHVEYHLGGYEQEGVLTSPARIHSIIFPVSTL